MMPAEFLVLASFLPEPVFLISGGGQIAACNDAGATLMGLRPEEIAGRPISKFIAEPPGVVDRLLESCHDGSTPTSCDLAWRQRDGLVVKRHSTVTPLPGCRPNSQRAFLLLRDSDSPGRATAPPVKMASEAPSGESRATAYSVEYLAAIIDSSVDAIIGRDLDGRITCWNMGAEQLFGYSAEEMLGNSLAPLIPADRRHEHDHILNIARRGETVSQFETLRQARDGRLIEVSITTSPIKDEQGTIIGTSTIPRDISILKEHEREIERLSRLYAALSQVNQAIVWLPDRDKLFQKICQVLVEFGGLRMAWIGWVDEATQRTVPVAQFGDESGYLSSISVYVDDRPEGQGPSGKAFRTGRPYVCNNMLDDPSTLAWQSEFSRCGFQACTALPIRMAGEVRGILAVYADQLNFFHQQEVVLLEEVALDISFALDNLAREEARQRADIVVRHERDFSDAVLKSLPGILYLYDRHGRFLRWNQNFEDVSGYGADEIRTMHPTDFFSDSDKSSVDAKIQQVFLHGAANVEAGFVSKDGKSTPYYFTGVAIRIDDRDCLIGVGIDISERKHSEILRHESDARYRALFDHAPDGIVISNLGGHYIDVNPSICQMLGYSREELIGRHATEIVDDDEIPQVAPALEAIASCGRHHREWRFRRRDGSVFPAEVSATRMPDGCLLASIRDVTERVRSETQLRESAERLRESEAHLLHAQRIARLGSWELNIHDSSLHWSDQIYDIFEIERDKFTNSLQAFIARVHPDDRDELYRAQRAAIAGEARLDFEHRIVLPDGREKYLLEQADLKRDESGQPWKLYGIVIDISDRRRAEVEREKRHRAEAADRIKSAFLATMSHELRTPLNSIIGFTGIILQGLAGPLNAEQRKQLEMVRGSARHLLALVNDVLDISKIEAGQLEVAQESFDLRTSIEKVTSLVAPLAVKKGLQFIVDVASDLSEAVGDQRRFEQILWNLLSNAMKFTDRGQVTLTAGLLTGDDSPDANASGSVMRVTVSDTGVGIKPDDLNKLFQPFRQLDSGLTRHHEGTGLGLAISRRLANLMGGEIRAESVWGQGSEFHLTLPLAGSALR